MLLHENENVTKERVAIGQTKKSIDRKRNTDFLVQCPLIFKIFCDFLIKYFSNAKGQFRDGNSSDNFTPRGIEESRNGKITLLGVRGI